MKRTGGILLHITSLPGIEGIGTMGKEAFDFVDTLAKAGLKLWQILPLGPTGYGNSPYQCYSAFAGNPVLIDLNFLVKAGLLLHESVINFPKFNKNKVEFERVIEWKYPLLRQAYLTFQNMKSGYFIAEYEKFVTENGWWLNDFALFMAIKSYFKDIVWNQWDENIKFRDSFAIDRFRSELSDETGFHKFLQFIFFDQWLKLKKYANSKGIRIIGDVPLYISADSADVWTNPDIFLLDQDFMPTHVGGVPPDYFSEVGQLWGNPVYNWQRIKERNFDWWLARLHFNLRMFDLVRVDHFRGLESFWAVPAAEETAVIGEWIPALGYELLERFRGQTGELRLIAEDLGVITPEVEKLRDDFGLPGMKIFQFAFSSDAANEYLPHNYDRNFAAYTGTHDNDTTLGWYKKAEKKEKRNLRKYYKGKWQNITPWAVESVWASVADIAIAPLQDILKLDSEARMNIPGTASGNWGWRFRTEMIKPKHVRFMKDLGEKYRRIEIIPDPKK